jgi:hypothetical protein
MARTVDHRTATDILMVRITAVALAGFWIATGILLWRVL